MSSSVIARSKATKQSLGLHRALLREYFSGRTGSSSPKVLRPFLTRCLAMTMILMVSGVHQVMSEETFTNRLIHEKSPYLLQHARNPVDWYPWGEEAFLKARQEDKPIFLSIGYSTCHWCHVMEEESFTNPEIAKILNDRFVAIKVDREERPDVDHIYMQAVMAMTGAGGWPLSIFLTPELKPFYGGTYFPPTDRWGRSGFTTILNAIHQKWVSQREEVLGAGEKLTQALQSETEKQAARTDALGEKTLEKAYEQLRARFDSDKGGFSEAPKFPQAHLLSFLLRYWKRTKEAGTYRDAPLQMVQKTLDEMSRGGIYDHLGGGFHRYSTDGEWRVPHFEKMLYDQAILSKAYLEAYQATRNETYAQTAREIFDYVIGTMQGPEGGFYSAEDADSAPDASKPDEKQEGAFYVWPEGEIISHLGAAPAEIFNYYYGVEPRGNALNDPQGELEGKNVLYAAHSFKETAEKFGKSESEIQNILSAARRKLMAVRGRRLRPHLDDKVLTDWNGLMISSLAFGSRVLDEPRYATAAKRAADFLLQKMKREDGRLMHRYRDGDVSVPGFLEDHAFFANGLIDLYEATFDARYLKAAAFFAKEMPRLFWDESGGGFFLTGEDAEKLIARAKASYDGAIPSGNSVAALALLRMARITMDREFETQAQAVFDAFSAQLVQYPSGFSQMMIALDFAVGPSREIVIAGEEKDSGISEMVREIYARFLPNKVVVFHPSHPEAAREIEALSPFTKNQVPLAGKTTVYVCKNYVCDLPVHDTAQLSRLLGK